MTVCLLLLMDIYLYALRVSKSIIKALHEIKFACQYRHSMK